MNLRTLGGLQLEDNGFRRPKPLLLLAYLALEGPQQRRDLTALFFPDSDQRADALSTTLRRLRTVGDVIDDSGGRIAATVACDADLLQRACEDNEPERAVEVYAGVFAAGLSGNLGIELEDWVFQTRERLAGLVRLAHLKLGERALERGDAGQASRHAESSRRVPGAREPELAEEDRLKRLLKDSARMSAGRTGTARISNLPLPLTSFVGRTHEKTQLLETINRDGGRLVTVHGPGGVGKSRLALEVARLVFEGDSNWAGVHVAVLEMLEQLDGLPVALALAMDLPPPAGPDPFGTLAASIGASRRIVVLDNFEHLVEAAPTLSRLLSTCSGLVLIVTSRERLNVHGEWVLDLEGLPIAPHDANVEDQRSSAAVALFIDRACHARLDLAFAADDVRIAVQVCELTDGYPLALELAAASLRSVPLAELARNLTVSALDLESPHRDTPDRHRSVRTTFEVSWKRLTTEDRHGLACLASFQGGFDRQAALAVAGIDGRRLEGFADRSFVQVSASGRFGFHPLLHTYLRQKLSEDPDHEKDALGRHALFFGDRLRTMNVQAHGAADAGVMDYMASEEGNLVALLRHNLRHREFDALASLAEPFLWFLPLRGRFADALRLSSEVLAGLPEDDPAANGALAAFLTNDSWLFRLTGDLEQATALARRALALAETGGDALQRMRVLDGLGQALFLSGSFDEGVTNLAEALELAKNFGDDTRLLRALSNLGAAYTTAGDMDRATHSYAEARALYDAGRVQKGMDVVWLLSNIGYQQVQLAEFAAVISICDEGLRVALEARCDGQMTLLWALVAFARLECFLARGEPGDLKIAEETCAHAIPAARLSGEKFSGVMLFAIEGRIVLERGNATGAAKLLLKSLSLALESDNRIVFAWGLPYYIEALIALGRVEKAAELLGLSAAQASSGQWMRMRVARLEGRLEPLFRDRAALEAAQSRGLLLSAEGTKERLLKALEVADDRPSF